MNPGIRYFILYLLISIPIGELFCQNEPESKSGFSRGFIMNNRGDTIDGFIGLQYKNTLRTTCIFKSARAADPELFGPFDLSGYGSYADDQLFISIAVPMKNGEQLSFVRLLFDGTYNLYYYESLGVKHFLVKKPDNTIVDITYPPPLIMDNSLQGMSIIERFNQTVSSIFFHTPAIMEYAKEVKPEVNSMMNFFKKYHQISGDPFTIYKGIHRSFSIGLVTGVTFDKLLLNISDKKIQSFSDPSPYAGFYFKLANKKTGSGMFIQSTIGYKTHHYSYSVEDQVTKDYYETFIKSLASIFRIGFTLNPSPDINLRPFLEGGVLALTYLNPRYDNYRDQLLTDANTVFSFYNHSVLNSTLYYGAFLRTGTMINLKNKNSLRFSGGYDFLMSTGSERFHSIDLSITYMMKFK